MGNNGRGDDAGRGRGAKRTTRGRRQVKEGKRARGKKGGDKKDMWARRDGEEGVRRVTGGWRKNRREKQGGEEQKAEWIGRARARSTRVRRRGEDKEAEK